MVENPNRHCRLCGAPVIWAREQGQLVLCDRQQTLDGDISLHDASNDAVIAQRLQPGAGRYREHVCGFNSKDSDKARTPEEQQLADVVAALGKADKIAASFKTSGVVAKRGTLGFALQVLAREVRALRIGGRPVDDAIDELVATYLPLIDELPRAVVVKIELVRACRRSYYM